MLMNMQVCHAKTFKHIKLLLPSLLIFVSAIIGVFIGAWQIRPMSVDASSPNYPAFLNMMSNIERLAVYPRLSGSANIEYVREQLIIEIEGMGLEAIVDDASYTYYELAQHWMRIYNAASIDEWWDINRVWIEQIHNINNPDDWFRLMVRHQGADTLQNIFVRLEASGATRGILFVSHYDTVLNSPGAADAMLPVSIMLEVLRAHAQNDMLENNIYFLFTDGEENLALGAFKFLDANPELRDNIDMVVNLEMRGNRGVPIIFETSPASYRQIRAIAQSGARPVAFSWVPQIYTFMPHITDFSAFLYYGYEGVNIAAIEGVEHYHTPTDTYENLDRNTAWQYFLTVMSIADYAANHPMYELDRPSTCAVYFPFLPGRLVIMTASFSHLLSAIACILTLIYIATQRKKHKHTAKKSPLLIIIIFLLLSIASGIWFAAGSYLFYIPLFAVVISKATKRSVALHIAVKMVSIAAVLIIWTPTILLLWIGLVQPVFN